jgi:GAF domain-containing protein
MSGSVNKQQGAFTTEDEEVLKAVVTQAAIAIEMAQLMGGPPQQRDALIAEYSQLWQVVEGQYFQYRYGKQPSDAASDHINRTVA